MFAAPIATGRAHPALHFIEDEEDFVFVANLSQRLQPFAPEMVIAALALDRLNDNGADVDLVLADVRPDFLLRLLLTRDHIGFALRFWQRKINARTRNARPIELGEQIRFARIGVGKAHGVTAASVKRVTKMQNLRAALPMT